MRESAERSTPRVSDTHDPLLSAYAGLCAAISEYKASGNRVADATITQLEDTTAALRARTDSSRAHYVTLSEGFAHAAVLMEMLQALTPTDTIDFSARRGVLRGELRRTLATIQFIHVTPEELVQCAAFIAVHRQQRAAAPVTKTIVSPRPRVTARRRANVATRAATRVIDRVAAVARQGSFATGLALAQA